MPLCAVTCALVLLVGLRGGKLWTQREGRHWSSHQDVHLDGHKGPIVSVPAGFARQLSLPVFILATNGDFHDIHDFF